MYKHVQCHYMYSHNIHTEFDKLKVLAFRFSWPYRYSANTVCTQRYWFSGFQGFHGLILVHVQCHSMHTEFDKDTDFQVFKVFKVFTFIYTKHQGWREWPQWRNSPD